MTTLTHRPWTEASLAVEGRLTTLEAMKFTKSDYTVAKISQTSAPVLERGEDVDLFGIRNPEKAMTIREDTRSYLGTVGLGYKVVQNPEAVGFFDNAVGEGAACVTAVGHLGKHGARFFMVASVPEMLEIVPGDPIERHILLTNTHDMSGPIEAIFVSHRLLSGSTIEAPIKKQQHRVRIKHTSRALDHLQEAHRVMHNSQDYWDRAIRAYRYMAKKDVDEQRVRAFVEHLFPDVVEKGDDGKPTGKTHPSPQALTARESIRELFEGGAPGSDHAGKTEWGLFNAVAYFVCHERRRSKSQKSNGITQWEIATFGGGYSLRSRAMNWLMGRV